MDVDVLPFVHGCVGVRRIPYTVSGEGKAPELDVLTHPGLLVMDIQMC